MAMLVVILVTVLNVLIFSRPGEGGLRLQPARQACLFSITRRKHIGLLKFLHTFEKAPPLKVCKKKGQKSILTQGGGGPMVPSLGNCLNILFPSVLKLNKDEKPSLFHALPNMGNIR